jgi:hypothetical protein
MEVIANIGPAEVTVTAEPIDEPPSLLDTSQELVASPSDTRTEEPPWPHAADAGPATRSARTVGRTVDRTVD